MTLKSKSYFNIIVFSFLGCLFAFFWMVCFIGFIVFGGNFEPKALFLLPVLMIPLGMMFILQNFLNKLVFTENGVTVYKMLILKYRKMDWTGIDYSINTIEEGKNGSSRVIYLVKDKTLVLRISENNYRNFIEIENFICSHIESKGFIRLNFLDTFKYFTKKPINKLP